ncbi:MAG: sugar ABC transporter ATP-binding protein, partial [Candidatus Nanosalina sp.]
NEEKDITVMLTTHDIGDIEDLCERVVVLDEGEKIYDGELDSLVDRFTSRRMVLDVRNGENFDLELDGVQEIEREEAHIEVVFDREVLSASDLMREVLENYEVLDFQLKEPDIESVVKKVYNEGL